jgi:SNF family Na+-dependent transporter
MQTLGALLAVLTLGWCVSRSAALAQLQAAEQAFPQWLFWWIRFGIPVAIISVGAWWFVTSVTGSVAEPS